LSRFYLRQLLAVLSPLTGDRYASLSSSTPIDGQRIFFDKTTRLIAGSRISPKRSELFFLAS
jgi:hypothetical protein